jgi:hypothetical protein
MTSKIPTIQTVTAITTGTNYPVTSSMPPGQWPGGSLIGPAPMFNHEEIKIVNESICNRLDAIETRLAIIFPDTDLIDKYPALREAYEHYKLIEKLVQG